MLCKLYNVDMLLIVIKQHLYQLDIYCHILSQLFQMGTIKNQTENEGFLVSYSNGNWSVYKLLHNCYYIYLFK